MSTITLFESFRRPGAYILSTVKEIQQKLVNSLPLLKMVNEIEKMFSLNFTRNKFLNFVDFVDLNLQH